MATVPLPERPNLDQLRRQARELQRGVRAGESKALKRAGLDAPDATFPLTSAQRALARRYGFTSWPKLHHHVEAIAARTWVSSEPSADDTLAEQFLRLACLDYTADSPVRRADAAELLRAHPELPDLNLAVAAVCADVGAIRRHLSTAPMSETAVSGPHGWSPLMYAAYSRIDAGLVQTMSTAQLLLDAGADPNDGRFFLGLPTPFTILTGVFGGGEGDQPPHPHAIPLARLLLASGAEPNDGQTLYNRMFRPEDDFLELLFEFGLGEGDGGPWRRLLPDLLPRPAKLVRDLLRWAVTHNQRERVDLLARNGVDMIEAFGDGVAPIDVAIRNGYGELTVELERLGARRPLLSPVDAFIASALMGDADKIRDMDTEVVDAAKNKRPALVVWAASQERIDAVELIIAAGFDVNAFGRGDVPVEQQWQTALHTAVERANTPLALRLVALGADKMLRDKRFDSTPADWANHFGNPELAALLTP